MVHRPRIIPGLLSLVWGCAVDKTSPVDTSDSIVVSDPVDADGDGHPAGDDCDDSDAGVYPGALEHCDGVDEDCDGTVDEDPSDTSTWYVDSDGDGYGAVAVDTPSCDAPTGAVGADGDCDDEDSTVHPGAAEVCDGVDQDCDGTLDEEASNAVECVPDIDGDGYGQDVSTQTCCALGDGWVAPGEADCDDDNRTVNPSGQEICNLLDDDCDGETDEDDDGEHTVDSLCDLWQDHVLADADVKILGDYAAGQRSSFLLTDADADGYDDLWLGDENAFVDDAPKTGIVYLLPGPILGGGYAGDLAEATVTGTAAYDAAGQALSDAGDLNNDGYPDLWISAATDLSTPGGGSIHLMLGPLAGEYTLDDSDMSWIPDVSGWGLVYPDLGAGDYDGDEIPDLIIGSLHATGNAGARAGMAWVLRYDGDDGEHNLSDAAIIFEASTADDCLGWAVAIIGSTTGDGTEDVLVSAFGEDTVDGAGQVWIMDDAPPDGHYVIDDVADTSLVGEQPIDNAAAEVTDLGDMNGDGYTDFGIGAVGESSAAEEAGAVYVVYGPTGTRTSAAEADVKLQGVDEKSMVHLIAGDADIDADGHLDLVVSGYNSGDGDLYGVAFLVRGPLEPGTSSLADADATFDGEGYHHYAGSGLSVSGDTNKDGYPDIVIGAKGYVDETHDGSALYLYFGQPF